VAKVRPSAFWFYGNEKFILTVVGLALGTSGFVVGDRISDATSATIKRGNTPWGQDFGSRELFPPSSPYSDESFHPVCDLAGNVACVIRLRVHENGRVSILGVRK
jgi:hypothetical protein